MIVNHPAGWHIKTRIITQAISSTPERSYGDIDREQNIPNTNCSMPTFIDSQKLRYRS